MVLSNKFETYNAAGRLQNKKLLTDWSYGTEVMVVKYCAGEQPLELYAVLLLILTNIHQVISMLMVDSWVLMAELLVNPSIKVKINLKSCLKPCLESKLFSALISCLSPKMQQTLSMLKEFPSMLQKEKSLVIFSL